MEHALHPLLPRAKVLGVGSLVLRFFRLEHPRALMRRTYFWTALSGGCFCASSFVLLVLIVRLLGEPGAYWGGVFSIALAISQQLITIGLFQMRPFQVSDVDEAYSFSEYLVSRTLTVGLMVAAGAVWIVAGGVGHDKAVALLLLLGRGLRWVYRRLARLLGRWIGPRAATAVAWLAVTGLTFLIPASSAIARVKKVDADFGMQAMRICG